MCVLSTATVVVAIQILSGSLCVHGGEPPNPGTGPAAEETVDLTIALQFPRETPLAEVTKIIEALKKLKGTGIVLRDPEVAKGSSAEVTFRPGVPSKDVAAAVRVLLDSGIRKISVEVKK